MQRAWDAYQKLTKSLPNFGAKWAELGQNGALLRRAGELPIP